ESCSLPQCLVDSLSVFGLKCISPVCLWSLRYCQFKKLIQPFLGSPYCHLLKILICWERGVSKNPSLLLSTLAVRELAWRKIPVDNLLVTKVFQRLFNSNLAKLLA